MDSVSRRLGRVLVFSTAAGIACLLFLSAALAQERQYDLDYRFRLDPEREHAKVTIAVRQGRDLLRVARFRHRPKWHSDFAGDGDIEITDEAIVWRPPAKGGELHYLSRVDHQRASDGFDSMMTSDFALFRGDDLVPAARVTTVKGARSRARIRIDGPNGWTSVTPFGSAADKDGWVKIERPDRGFVRPVGWILAGRLGTRWDDVGATRVVVAGPLEQGVRRMDILAFVRWHLPELSRVFPSFPERLLIVSAGDPMWRGGLSGPSSLYIHAERPLLSENGTSTLLHEMVHVAQGYGAAPGADWIVEGMAEFYGLEIMLRAGTLSRRRFKRAMTRLTDWAEKSTFRPVDYSSGPITARGARIMYETDRELRDRTGGASSLDDVARRLAAGNEPVSLERLRAITESIAGGPLDALQPDKIGIE